MTTPSDARNPLPGPVAAFLMQITDMPGQSKVDATSYAASVILPKTRWPGEDFFSRLVADLCRPANLAVLERHLPRQMEGVFDPFTLSFNNTDGAPCAFSVQARPVRLSGGKSAIASSLAPVLPDADPMLSTWSSEARLISLLDALPVYVAIVDRDHNLRYDNKMFRQLFGRGGGRGRERKCYEAMRGRTAPCPNCGPLSVIATRTLAISEWTSDKLNNAFRVHSYPCVDPQGNKAVLKVGLNITAGVRARNALDLSEQRYRSVTDNLTVGVALVDPLRNVVMANPRLLEWFGPDAGKGASICDVLRRHCEEEAGGCAACPFLRCMETREPYERDFSLLTQDGGSRHFRQTICPITSRRGDAHGTLMMLEDSTERHNLAIQMQHLQRLESMGALAGGIAHEINQPLSALHLYAGGLQMLLEQGDSISPERIMGRLDLILKQAAKIREITDHMRALVMQEDAPALTPSSVQDAATAALALIGAQLTAHGITVQVALPETLPLVLATPVQMEQVFINLLINAMHALDTVEHPAKEIRIEQAVAEPGFVRVRIVDNGPGVQGMEEKVFDPFFTTKEAHRGMGLGLSIVHAFVRAWGGDIRVRNNRVNPGASFTLTLKTA